VISIRDKVFTPYIRQDKILKAVKVIAERITADLQGKNPLFIGILNGSFIFAADLLRELPYPCEIAFIKVGSYEGMESSGKVSLQSDFTVPVTGRSVVIVEDIVDSGLTIAFLRDLFEERGAAEVKVASLLFKPGALRIGAPPDYSGFEIRNEFVIGYGLDYDGIGRNLKDIHILAEIK
jgi:hypoxanthine phosphoribosyltransferase